MWTEVDPDGPSFLQLWSPNICSRAIRQPHPEWERFTIYSAAAPMAALTSDLAGLFCLICPVDSSLCPYSLRFLCRRSSKEFCSTSAWTPSCRDTSQVVPAVFAWEVLPVSHLNVALVFVQAGDPPWAAVQLRKSGCAAQQWWWSERRNKPPASLKDQVGPGWWGQLGQICRQP